MKPSKKNMVKGKGSQVTGKIKQKIGASSEDPDLEDQGTLDKVKGKIQEKIGQIQRVFEK